MGEPLPLRFFCGEPLPLRLFLGEPLPLRFFCGEPLPLRFSFREPLAFGFLFGDSLPLGLFLQPAPLQLLSGGHLCGEAPLLFGARPLLGFPRVAPLLKVMGRPRGNAPCGAILGALDEGLAEAKVAQHARYFLAVTAALPGV